MYHQDVAQECGARSAPRLCSPPHIQGPVARTRLSKEELQAKFSLSIESAAMEMRIGVTTLKKLCRQHGISRWPFRTVQQIVRTGKLARGGLAGVREYRFLLESLLELELGIHSPLWGTVDPSDVEGVHAVMRHCVTLAAARADGSLPPPETYGFAVAAGLLATPGGAVAGGLQGKPGGAGRGGAAKSTLVKQQAGDDMWELVETVATRLVGQAGSRRGAEAVPVSTHESVSREPASPPSNELPGSRQLPIYSQPQELQQLQLDIPSQDPPARYGAPLRTASSSDRPCEQDRYASPPQQQQQQPLAPQQEELGDGPCLCGVREQMSGAGGADPAFASLLLQAVAARAIPQQQRACVDPSPAAPAAGLLPAASDARQAAPALDGSHRPWHSRSAAAGAAVQQGVAKEGPRLHRGQWERRASGQRGGGRARQGPPLPQLPQQTQWAPRDPAPPAAWPLPHAPGGMPLHHPDRVAGHSSLWSELQKALLGMKHQDHRGPSKALGPRPST